MTTGYQIITGLTLLALLVSNVNSTKANSTRRPNKCVKCSQADKVHCKPLPSDCEQIPEPNCGCCMMCAKKVGENCGVATGICGAGLECIPPPLTQEDYNEYGPSDYFMDAFLGNFICVTKERFMSILTGAAYFDDSDLTLDASDIYIPDLEALAILDELAESQENFETEAPTGDALVQGEVTARPQTPPMSQFSHFQKPCTDHESFVWNKAHFDHHEWIPSCTNDGSYYPEQCELSYGLERGRCWCVNSVGKPVTGFTDGDKVNTNLCSS